MAFYDFLLNMGWGIERSRSRVVTVRGLTTTPIAPTFTMACYDYARLMAGFAGIGHIH